MSATPPYVERRAPSSVGSTADVPVGTLLNVPSVAPNGRSAESPVVAVNTTHWYKDPAFMSALLGAVYALSEPVIQALQTKGPINWRSLALGCVLAIVAWLRNRTNTVTK